MRNGTFTTRHPNMYIVEKNLLYIQEKDKQSDLVRKRRIIVKEEDKELYLCATVEWMVCTSGETKPMAR